MPPISAETLLAPVSDDDPCGPDLEYDQAFGELNRAAEGKPERQSGSVIIAAEEPDWREVEGLADGLLERSRDLRALVHLAHARLHRTGLPGFAETVTLTRELLATRWDGVHPRLDPEDDNDPIGRKNALATLSHPRLVLRYLRTLPLTTARTGRLSWRDMALAAGRLQAEQDEDKLSLDAVRGAFRDSDRAVIVALRAAADATNAALIGINATFDDLAGTGSGPDYDDLGKLLRDIRDFIDQYGPGLDDAAEPAPDAEQPTGAPTTATAATAPSRQGAAMSIAAITEVTNRADAVRLLGLVVQYFHRNEPSSPLPLLIDRAVRLADKNFLEILRDLAPEGLMQAQNVTGIRDE